MARHGKARPRSRNCSRCYRGAGWFHGYSASRSRVRPPIGSINGLHAIVTEWVVGSTAPSIRPIWIIATVQEEQREGAFDLVSTSRDCGVCAVAPWRPRRRGNRPFAWRARARGVVRRSAHRVLGEPQQLVRRVVVSPAGRVGGGVDLVAQISGLNVNRFQLAAARADSPGSSDRCRG